MHDQAMKAVDGFYAIKLIANMAWSIQLGLVMRESTSTLVRLERDAAFNERVCRVVQDEVLAILSGARAPVGLQLILDRIEEIDRETPRSGGARG